MKNQDEYMVAIIPPDFAERFRASKPATIKLVADSARADTFPQVDRVRRLFEQYNAQIGSLRLVGRGVSPAVATPVVVQEVEVSTTQQRAARLLAVIPLMILLAAFTGAMQIATDATAGERERGSLEALLINPVPRSALAVGKTMAAALTAMIAVTLTAAICAALLRFIPLQEMGMRFRFGAQHFAGMMAAVLPMCLVTAAMQSCVATHGALLQGGAELHGHPDPGADAGRRARHHLPDRQPAVDVRRADAGAVRAADQRAGGPAAEPAGVRRRRR